VSKKSPLPVGHALFLLLSQFGFVVGAAFLAAGCFLGGARLTDLAALSKTGAALPALGWTQEKVGALWEAVRTCERAFA
jgi:hypothetical protein